MSSSSRKIGYYAIWLEKEGKKILDFDCIIDYLKRIYELPGKDRIICVNNNAIDIDKYECYVHNKRRFVKLIFKSCKYNHSPNYMSSIDGTERDTQKKLFEGEKEITHMLIRIPDDKNNEYDMCVVFEERRTGVSFANALKHINKNMDKLQIDIEKKERIFLNYAYVPAKDFLESLKDNNRVMSVDLFMERKVLGSDFLNLMDTDETVQEEVVISVRAKRQKSLSSIISNLFHLSNPTNSDNVKRIRLHCKDDNNTNIVLDTLAGKKAGSIEVELDENSGIVNSFSIFGGMEELLLDCDEI